MVEVDNGEAGAIRHWQHQLNQITVSADGRGRLDPARSTIRWRLVERTAGQSRQSGRRGLASGVRGRWASTRRLVGRRHRRGRPAGAGRRIAPGSREYSIASLPSDGRVEFLIRLLMRHPDGTARPGLGLADADDWRCRRRRSGCVLRPNRSFHGPDDAQTPMILIGNGTGHRGPAGASEGADGRADGGHLAAVRRTGSRRTTAFYRWRASGLAAPAVRADPNGSLLLARCRRRALCAGFGR